MAGLIGQQLGQYEIVAQIGRGGMATVYRARHKSLDRDVAIKVIKPELAEGEGGDFVERFRREARTVASLKHPHILKVFDYGEHGDLVYLVMELVEGGALSDLIRRGPVPTETVSLVLDQIAPALDYAHRRGIIHRDLKPQNVLSDADGNAFLTDFGIARLLHETTQLTKSGMAMGTPAYMAPEQWSGQPVDARTDIYALGIMLFEMLTGRVPFNADTPFRMMHMHIYEPPPLLNKWRSDLPPDVQQVIDKALAKNGGERFGSPSEMAVAFNAALAGEALIVDTGDTAPPGIQMTKPPEVSPPAPTVMRRRTPALWIGLLAVILVLGAILIPAILGSLRSGPPATATFTTVGVSIVSTNTSTMVILPTVSLTPILSQNPGALPTAQPSPTLTMTPSVTRTSTPSGPSLTPSDTPNGQTLVAATFVQRTVNVTHTIGAYTKTPTYTPTPTGTYSPTPNLQATIEAGVAMTDTAIAIASFTKTPTYTPTLTPTSTFTPTSTYTPTFTPSPTAIGGGSGKIAFSSYRDGNWQVYVMDVDGKNPHNLSNNKAHDSEPAWSPDGRQIAFASNRDGNWEIYVMDADGKNPRNLSNNKADDEFPAWSPDGTHIAFRSDRDGHYQIYVMDADGKNPRNLSANKADDGASAWSPDGTHIAFRSNRSGSNQIYVMDANGGIPQNLSNSKSDDYYPAWSPDEKQIAFASKRDGNDQIYLMDADGKNQHNLSNNKANDDFPAWSPDGRQIAFKTDRDGNNEIYVMDADGKNQRNLSNNKADDEYPAWQPTPGNPAAATATPVSSLTNQMAFASNRDGNYEIYSMDSSGGSVLRLTSNDVDDLQPAWSPDGKQIAFTSKKDGNFNIHIMDANGNNKHALTTDLAEDVDPAWSPDGKWIAFASSRDGNFEIYVMDADGKNPRNLTQNAADDVGPAWSPDGKQIAFESGRDGNSEIYLMNADGGNPRRLTNNGDLDVGPDWSPDGKQIAFDAYRDGYWHIYLMDGDGSNQHDLINIGTAQGSPDWSPDGTLIAYASYVENQEIFITDTKGGNPRNITNNPAADNFVAWRPSPAVVASTPVVVTGTPTLGVSPTSPAAASTPVLAVGMKVTVNVPEGANLKLRQSPDQQAKTVMLMPKGTKLILLARSVDGDGTIWWQVKVESGETGWCVQFVGDLQVLQP